MADEKEKKKKEQNGHFCGRITQLIKRLDELGGVALQYTSEAGLCLSFVCALLYLMYGLPFKITPSLYNYVPSAITLCDKIK